MAIPSKNIEPTKDMASDKLNRIKIEGLIFSIIVFTVITMLFEIPVHIANIDGGTPKTLDAMSNIWTSYAVFIAILIIWQIFLFRHQDTKHLPSIPWVAFFGIILFIFLS